MVKLFIDTRNVAEIIAKIDKDGELFEEISTTDTRRPESILLVVDRVCKKAGIEPREISEINAEEGPGSYTGLKVGISVANALSFSLEKKVNGLPLGELAKPQYQ